jgi:hypothetical protein
MDETKHVHVEVKCSVENCGQEGMYFYEDKSKENDTFYLCEECSASMSDGGENEYILVDDEKLELGIYCCSENCEVCN